MTGSWTARQRPTQLSVKAKATSTPGEQQEEYGRALHRFYASANNGLRLNSSFYWSALLWNDDYKPGDTDNFQLFINDIPDD